MPRRETPPPHLVLFDTSTLFFSDKSEVVDPRVDQFLRAYRQQFTLQIRIPEVVAGELLYQQTSQALSHLEKANSAIDGVSKITEKSYSHRVTEERVRRETKQRLQRWMDSHNAQMRPTPTSRIDWDTLVDSAIWRKSPFTAEDGKEKGFRDALILETVVDAVEQHPDNQPIAFICKDKVLRGATTARLAHDTRFSAYERTADFQSYLDLTLENLEDRFIKAILKRAQAKFFSHGDDKCLAYREELPRKLREKYAAYFSHPEKAEEAKGLFGGITDPINPEWESIHTGKFWIGAPEFLEKTEDNIYSWRSEIEYAEPYKRTAETSNSLLAMFDSERVHVMRFAIRWSSKVTSNGRFMNVQYEDDELSSNEFRTPTNEEKAMWNLRYDEG